MDNTEMSRTVGVSLVSPVYNEEANIVELVHQVEAAMDPSDLNWELILVDDGSTDGSWANIQACCESCAPLRGLRLARNSGQTAAFVAGFRAARGGFIVTLDADLQNDPGDIPGMLQEMKKRNADGAIGIRQDRNDNWVRRWSSLIANSYRRARTDDDTIDTGCSLKVFRAEFLAGFPNFAGMHRYIPSLARLNGAANILQVPVNHRPRLHGVSKYGVWNRLWVGLADVRAVNWMQRRHRLITIAEECGNG